MSRQPLLKQGETINHERKGIALLAFKLGLPELAHDLITSKRTPVCHGKATGCMCPRCLAPTKPKTAEKAKPCQCDPPATEGTCLRCGREARVAA